MSNVPKPDTLLTAESRGAAGTQDTVEMVDPSGNCCSVSVRHQKDGGDKVIDEKLKAGWTFAPVAAPPALAAEPAELPPAELEEEVVG